MKIQLLLAFVVCLSGRMEAQEGAFEEPIKVLESPWPYWSQHVTPDGLMIVFNLRSPHPSSIGGHDIFWTTRASVDEPFDVNVKPFEELNTEYDDGGAWLSPDERTVYFYSGRPGGSGDWDIWSATRDDTDERFDEPQPVTELNSPFREERPTLTEDGKTIVFVSNRPDGRGERDLYIATRAEPGDPFGPPSNLDAINTPFDEFNPGITADGLTLFWSNLWTWPDDTRGSSDIWMARRSSTHDSFGSATNLDSPVNTSRWEISPSISRGWPEDGAILYFAGCEVFDPDCNEEGTDIYQATWRAATPGVPYVRGDTNADTKINIADGVFVLNWLFQDGSEPECMDAADTNADGGVDLSDAVYVFNFLFIGGGEIPPPGACGESGLLAERDEDCAGFAGCP